ncbi:signal transduction histidine kinase [Stackebrandtia endophytica]|uniref:histidine kinase n=1 Tax=Stackebrandtia endophytica TaxID=1496996 RepID=A0A543AQR4_9ACTN|nr:sensor histidine kinase [Stackebrandtia endophytica]TQL74904.1 signal transduction histidine kinase [Stackebrandtia endophytica]
MERRIAAEPADTEKSGDTTEPATTAEPADIAEPGGTAERGRAAMAIRRALVATKWLLYGVGTGLLALFMFPVMIPVIVACLLGIPLVRPGVLLLRTVAGLERTRLRAMGQPVASPYGPPPRTLREAVTDPSVRRDLLWIPLHGIPGLVLCLFGAQLLINALRELSVPLWWQLVPPSEASAFNGLVHVDSWAQAWLVSATGPVWFVLWLVIGPRIVRFHARYSARLLAPSPGVDMSARITQLTATRAAALDAHAMELRRIERALHDGAQNRLVGVAMLTGAARQAIKRDPDSADQILERVQEAAESALAELRSVVRGILPPILENRGLEGALTALAGDCSVDCSVEIDIPVRCPASVEATAYFTVAEALTNVSKHSGATNASVVVRRIGDRLQIVVDDDGRGGADPVNGSGLDGIRRRVAAVDGETRILSPLGGPTTIEVTLPCGSLSPKMTHC